MCLLKVLLHTSQAYRHRQLYKPVILHERLFRKCFITHNTDILTLATMYMLMFLDIRILTECIFTRITGIRTLATVYKLVCL